MRSRRRRPDPDQLLLDYSGPLNERVSAFRARLWCVSAEQLGVEETTQAQWEQAVEVLVRLFANCGGYAEGSYQPATRDTWLDELKMTKSTYGRAVRLLKLAGLLETERCRTRRGETRKPDRMWIVHEEIDQLVSASRDLISVKRGKPHKQRSVGTTRDHAGPQGTNRDDIEESFSPSVGQSFSLGRGRPDEGEKKKSAATPMRLPPPSDELATWMIRRIGRPRNEADLECGFKWAALIAVLSEHAVRDIAEGTARMKPRNPWRYAYKLARERCEQAGYKLDQLMARTEKPPPGWRPIDWPWDTRRTPGGERLCVADTGDDYG